MHITITGLMMIKTFATGAIMFLLSVALIKLLHDGKSDTPKQDIALAGMFLLSVAVMLIGVLGAIWLA